MYTVLVLAMSLLFSQVSYAEHTTGEDINLYLITALRLRAVLSVNVTKILFLHENIHMYAPCTYTMLMLNGV